jgi:hypothetical protein
MKHSAATRNLSSVPDSDSQIGPTIRARASTKPELETRQDALQRIAPPLPLVYGGNRIRAVCSTPAWTLVAQNLAPVTSFVGGGGGGK